MVATLAKLTRLKEDEGVLLALHPDYTRPRLSITRYICFTISVVLPFDDDAAILHGVGQVIQVEKTCQFQHIRGNV